MEAKHARTHGPSRRFDACCTPSSRAHLYFCAGFIVRTARFSWSYKPASAPYRHLALRPVLISTRSPPCLFLRCVRSGQRRAFLIPPSSKTYPGVLDAQLLLHPQPRPSHLLLAIAAALNFWLAALLALLLRSAGRRPSAWRRAAYGLVGFVLMSVFAAVDPQPDDVVGR